MDKKKEKWASDVLLMFENNYKGALQITLNQMRDKILDEYSKKWMKAVTNKYITTNPNFVANGTYYSKEKWQSMYLQVLQQNNISQSDCTVDGYCYDEGGWLAGVTIHYCNHEVTIFQGRKKEFLVRFPELNPEVFFGSGFAGTLYTNYLSYTKINVIGVLNFMKYDLEELIEEIAFKRDMAIHIWDRYLDLDPSLRMKSFSRCNLSISKLTHHFFEDIELERRQLYPKEVPTSDQIIALPTFNSVNRDPENQFIKPFIHFYHTYVDPDAKIEITKDTECRGGFVVKVNDKTAYIRITDMKTDKADYIYFEPAKINLYQTINNDTGKWVNLVLFVHLGLKHIDRMIALYQDIFSMYEQLPNNIKMVSIRPMLLTNSTETFDALPSVVYGPICKEDLHAKWSEDYDSFEQFYQLVADELVKRGHEINISIINEQIRPHTLSIEMIMDGIKIDLGVDYGDHGYKISTNYLGTEFLNHQVLPLNVDWMADYIENMSAFYHKIFS